MPTKRNRKPYKPPVVGQRRAGKNIPSTLFFGPDVEDEHPFEENVDWLRQWCTAGVCNAGYYLIVGTESYPEEIWHGYTNDIHAFFTCLWVRPDETEAEPV